MYAAKNLLYSAILLLCSWLGTNPKVFLHLKSANPSLVQQQQKTTAYHFQTPKNWINDPCGPMYYNGFYHLFYQYNPGAATWGDIIWGHSVSTDLINWRPLDPALTRTESYDTNGCWTGSATLLPGNKPAVLYTGRNKDSHQTQNLAFPKNLSDPFLVEWTKSEYNPVISPPEGIDPLEFRDPSTGWQGEDGYWRIVLGTIVDTTGTVLLFRSKDFVHWEEAPSPLHSVEGVGMWECPDFFPVKLEGKEGLDTSVVGNGGDVKHVMKVSFFDNGVDQYTLGRYFQEKDAYVVEENSVCDHKGLRYDYGQFYASKSFFDGAGKRRILWAWSKELDTSSDDFAAKEWSGIQTIPRAVWLDESGRQLMQWPIKEVESLRRKEVSFHDIVLKTGIPFEINGIKASQTDVEVDFDLPALEKAEEFDPTWPMDPQELCILKGASVSGGMGPFGVVVLASDHLEEFTTVFFRIFKSQGKYVALMCSDQSRSSLSPGVYKPTYGGFVDNIDVEKSRRISLRTLIDHYVVESFGAEGRTCITARVYPSLLLAGSRAHLYAFNNGTEAVRISKLKAWEMANAQIN